MKKCKKNKLDGITTEDLQEAIYEVVSLCFERNEASIIEIIGIDEVCRITGLSKYTIYKKTSNHEIPFYKSTMNRRSVLRFKRSEIENWTLKHRVGTVDEFLEKQDGL